MADLILPTVGSTSSSTYEQLFEEYIDNRILVFNNEVDDCVVEDYIMYILKWNMDDMLIPVENRKKITIIMSSPGGSSFCANMMVDVIMQSKTPVVGVALDLVASAAYIVYLACHERYAFKNSTFLQHEGDVAIENSRSKFKQTADFFDGLEERSKDFILSRTTMTEEFYDKMYEQEYWFFAQEGKQNGVVHKIIGEDCDLDEILE